MAKAKQKITTTAFIRVNGELVDVDTLNTEQRNYLGAKMQESILNSMHKGKIEFKADLPPAETVFPTAQKPV